MKEKQLTGATLPGELRRLPPAGVPPPGVPRELVWHLARLLVWASLDQKKGKAKRDLKNTHHISQIILAGWMHKQCPTIDKASTDKDLRELLKLSSGAVSMTLSELSRWGVVRKVWIQGERKDYYTAEVNLWRMISRVFRLIVDKPAGVETTSLSLA